MIRNNSLHANCIGLKAVLANGDVIDNMTTMRKDNTGYHLKHLFIGAEGTLGIITECALLCKPIETNRNLMMLAVESFDSVKEILKISRKSLGSSLSAFEFIDRQSVELLIQEFPNNAKLPFDQHYPFYLLVEVVSSDEDNEGRLYSLLESIGDHIVVSGL